MNTATDEWIPLGVVGKAHGLAGVVWFHPHNPATDSLRPGLTVRLVMPDGTSREDRVVRARPGSDGIILRLEGPRDRASADALRHAALQIRRADLPPVGEGEYYHLDLVGIAVHTQDGAKLGEVVRVESYPSVDALVVATADGELELPMVDTVVLSLDVPGRRAIVDLAPLE